MFNFRYIWMQHSTHFKLFWCVLLFWNWYSYRHNLSFNAFVDGTCVWSESQSKTGRRKHERGWLTKSVFTLYMYAYVRALMCMVVCASMCVCVWLWLLLNDCAFFTNSNYFVSFEKSSALHRGNNNQYLLFSLLQLIYYNMLFLVFFFTLLAFLRCYRCWNYFLYTFCKKA